MNEDSDFETRESSSNHEEQFRKEAKRDWKATLNSQFKDKSEDGGNEKIEKSVQDTLGLVRQESEAEKYRNEDETNKAKIKTKNNFKNYCFTAISPTERTSSRTNSHEDKVEMQDITCKYKVVNYVDKNIWSGTQISSR